MKWIFFVLIAFFAVSTAFSQELSEGQQAKNAGNEAYRNKDFVSAIDNWGKYLNSGEEGVDADASTESLYQKSFKYAGEGFMKKKQYDKAYEYFQNYIDEVGTEAANEGSTAYKMAYCATKMGDDAKALSQFQRSISLGYKEDNCIVYMANIYRKAGDEEKMIAILEEGLEKYPNKKNSPKMAEMLAVPMLKEAAVPFTKANELAKAASTGDPAEYLANMSKAVEKFKEAKPMFEKVLKYDPSNEQAKTYIAACDDNVAAFNQYKASLNN